MVVAFDLVVSGVTVNAVELAAAVQDLHGHEVVFFAASGPMRKLVEEKKLRFILAPQSSKKVHPSYEKMVALREVVHVEAPDLLHVWEWPQCLDVFYYEYLVKKLPIIVTDMSMNLQRILPKSVPTTFGTPELVEEARSKGFRTVELLLPAVDVLINTAGTIDIAPFKKRYALDDNEIKFVTVSRLDNHMKGESICKTMEAVSALGNDFPLKFLIVGDGDAKPELESKAEKINIKLGRQAIVLTGALIDPREAYAAADVIVGMGGSALRGMAFGKPVIICRCEGFLGPIYTRNS